MAQVSYGTITITDTNDIERIYTVYAKSANNTTVPVAEAADWKESISEAPGTGNYIWQRTVVQKSGTLEKTYSDPVCLTGEEGTDGRGITSITIKYGTSADWNTQPSSWYDNTPEYSSSTPNYWTQTTISYTSGNPTVKVTQDKALTQAIHDSVVANSLAQSANENANGAMGQAASNVNEVKRIWFLKNSSGTPSKPTSSTTIYNDNAANHWTTIRPTVTGYRYYYYCEQTTTGGGVKSWSDVYLDSSELSEYEIGAMKTRFQNFFYPGDSNYPGAYAVGKSSSDGLDITDVSTYGYNLRLTPTVLSIGYNELKAIELDGSIPALKLYKPSKTSQGTLTAQLDANGLTLKDGGIVAGTLGQSGYIYLSTIDHPTGNSGITINGFEPQQGSGEHWRQVIGTKFGVTDAGTLYAYDAHIEGQITIGGGYDITEAIENTLTFDTSYTFDNLDPHQTVTFTAHIYRGGVDITNNFYDEDFTWFYKTENNPTALPINTNANNQNNGKTITFNLSNIGYGCEIVGKFEPTSEANLLDSNSNNLTDANNTSLTTQTTESGNSVRVRDLSYITTLQQSDAIMAITSNSEKLITIANLANALQTTSVQIVRW